MWVVGVSRVRESDGGKVSTTVVAQQFKKGKKKNPKKIKRKKFQNGQLIISCVVDNLSLLLKYSIGVN